MAEMSLGGEKRQPLRAGRMEERLRAEVSSGFDNLYDTLSRHQHREDGAPTITLTHGTQTRLGDTSQR